MLKVKLFQRTGDPIELTNDINKWLTKIKDKFNINTIDHQVTGRMDATTVVMITYDDNGIMED